MTVTRAREHEFTALGAAGLAGLGAGLWSGLDDLAGHWAREASFEPTPDRRGAERLFAGWRRAVDRSRHWDQPDA